MPLVRRVATNVAPLHCRDWSLYQRMRKASTNADDAMSWLQDGYQTEVQLTQQELQALPALIALRIGQSLAIGSASVAQVCSGYAAWSIAAVGLVIHGCTES